MSTKNLEYINFSIDELLGFDNFETFLDSNPIKKATILSEILAQYLIISNHVLYIYNYNTITYSVVSQDTIQYLLMLCRKLIVQSYEKLDIKEKKCFRGYDLNANFKLDFYKDFIHDVYNMLVNNTIVFDQVSSHITHYRNGYYDVKKNQFYARDIEVHYITEFINEDYKETNPMQEDDEEDDVITLTVTKKKTSQFTKSEIKRIASCI
jgi:hypothetical protein